MVLVTPDHVGSPPHVSETVHLEVHPSVVFKLGADLITDDAQALIELVKNSYDADSPDAAIVVDTEVWTNPQSGEVVVPTAFDRSVEAHDALNSRELSLRGLIQIRDRGDGMTTEAITRGWLTVSASYKREMKRLGQVTSKNRTPLGDKGLGRLGAQRLGDILEIETRPKNSEVAHRIQIRWSDFDHASSLADVDLTLQTAATNEPPGTTLTIRGLRDPARWQGEGGKSLERELAAMISPFGKRGFGVSLRIDGDPIDLRRRHEEVRDSALLRYQLRYGDGTLEVEGRIATSYFRPNSASELPLYRELVERDNGTDFRGWLLATAPKEVGTLGMAPGDDQYFLEVKRTIRLADLAGVHMERSAREEAAAPVDPGPFAGEVDAVALRVGESNVFDSTAEYRDFVSAINGVRVYRDGFAVRVDSDWIGLASRWSSGTSFYNLRPENVVGYIDISARDNAQLEELTNREGFQDTPAFQNFMLLIAAWRRFTEECQGFVRRRWVSYRSAQAEEMEPRRPLTPDLIKQKAAGRKERLDDSVNESRRLSSAIDEAVHELAKERDGDLFGPAPDLTEPTRAAIVASEAATRMTGRLEELNSEYAGAMAELETLTGQIDAVQEQLADAWEAVSLGITAEALTHEVHQIADRLRSRSQQTLRYLAGINSKDLTVHAYVEHVRASAAALNRQMAHLNPALRYMRERRSRLQASVIANQIAGHYNENWADQNINVRVDVGADFLIEMNEGRLAQVLDNLVLNSGYWIREQRRRQHAVDGTITLHVDSPFLTVTDTGPGVDPSVEGLIFEPFVTTKGRGQGRGLGLFVVRQLLEPEGGEISLDPATDPDGRARTFRLTFRSAERVKP